MALPDNESLELVLDAKALLGEGPHWSEEDQQLYWVDILSKCVHIYDPQRHENQTIIVDQLISSVVVRSSGGLVITTEKGIQFLDIETETLTPIDDPESTQPGNRFNDGKCDPSGRFWAGTMDFDGAAATGSLYMLHKDLSIKTMKNHVTVSNGITWSPDYRVMYYVDSPTKNIVAFDYDNQTGHIKNERIVVTIPEGEGIPDGLTSDSEGNLWVAQWGGSMISKWNPVTGKRLDVIPVPATHVTSCAFGGPHLDELYITTARTDLDEHARASQPHAGGLFKLKTAVKGIPTFKFKG